MTTKLTWTPFFVAATAAALAFACSDDDKKSGPGDDSDASAGGQTGTGGKGGGTAAGGKAGGTGGGTAAGGKGGGTAAGGATPDGSVPDASTDGSAETDGGDGGMIPSGGSLCGGKTGADLVACGEYLVKHVDVCGDCHTPRTEQGAPDITKFLAGNPAFADLDKDDPDKGLVPTPNLTELVTLGWSKAEIKDALINGQRSEARGGPLFPIMPYYSFHSMADADADAIVEYIASLTAITNPIPARQPFPDFIDASQLPMPPVDVTKIPKTTLTPSDPHYVEAEIGRYLAAQVGVCVECHTPRVANTPMLDTSKFFAGGESYEIGGPFGTVVAANITPAANGIAGWTAEDVKTAILTGVTKHGTHICPPMPAGPMGGFGGMDPEQALDIGYYLTTIPGVSNPTADGGMFPMCDAPQPPPPSDAGP